MRKGWQTRRLGDVVTRLTNGYVGPTRNIYLESGVPYLLARHVKNNRLLFDGKTFISHEFNRKNKKSMLKAGDVLLVQSGHIGHSAVVTDEHEGHNCHAMIVISPVNDAVTGPFLSLFFNSPDMQRSFEGIRSGSTVPHLTCGAVKELQVPVPPLPEQQRIVGILDEAFEGIATAKANAEKNLQNARAIFESHLQSVFTQRGKGWVEKTIAECFKVRSGDFLPAKAMVESGEFDVYGGNGINGRHDKKNLTGGNIVIGRVGAKCGNVHHVEGDAWVTDNAIYISDYHCPFDLGFLTRLLRLKDLRSRANQMAQPVISYTTIKDVSLAFPASKVTQEKIVRSLDDLEVETQRLASLYTRKLAALDALKKSLLHQAFTGQL